MMLCALTKRSRGTKPFCSVQAALPTGQRGAGSGQELSPLLGSPPQLLGPTPSPAAAWSSTLLLEPLLLV